MQTPPRSLEWIDAPRCHILNALADDWESPEQIAKHFRDYVRVPIEPQLLADLLEELFARNYLFLTLNTLFDTAAILAELRGETDDRRFWFGSHRARIRCLGVAARKIPASRPCDSEHLTRRCSKRLIGEFENVLCAAPRKSEAGAAVAVVVNHRAVVGKLSTLKADA
jgi:hypothetical protein